MEKIKVLLIEDHPMMIEGLRSTLASVADIVVAGYALNGQDGLNLLYKIPVDVVISDINLPDINGIELCKQIKEAFSNVKVLALSNFNQYDYISQMMKNGANGYVLKNATKEELLEAIYAATTNKKYLGPELMDTLLQGPAPVSANLPRLTRREKEVLSMIASGLTNQEIADKLFVSITTVISHRRNLLTKFEVANTAALISLTMKHGLL
ncbi:response regulator transcription factor [Rhodocytophaga aerolata]|uniref:Response regulator transcription factor n=1 Tax=Rhodocytophaga aerolata TaxID=455078 RepID=A0ABT8RES4_9BACT|nr:response regulator transcription factor [Rhodocytophaga aerolata]MDO1449683.1 response regulator transcription factor [Rhodocytophaga aerolata]